MRDELAAYLTQFPAHEVSLPWKTTIGTPVTVKLAVTSSQHGACSRNHINQEVWKPSLRRAFIPATRVNGMHALRHTYASLLLDVVESIKAVSEYLGHSSAAFTLNTYTHLMPTSETRSRSAIDAALAQRAPGAPQARSNTPLASGDVQNRRNSSESVPRRAS